MLIVPTIAAPSQSLTVQLDGQSVGLNIYQKNTGMFMDVYVNNAAIITGVICEDRNRIVRDAYLGLVGDFSWVDSQGVSDPTYDQIGPGGRFFLAYFEAAEITGDV